MVKTALKAMNTSAAPPMKAGHEAVMQRWLMSAQKLRCRPSVTISRPPSWTTRALDDRSDVRSFWLLAIFLQSLEALGKGIWSTVPSWHNRTHFRGFFAVRSGGSSHGEYARTDPSSDSDSLAASDPDDRRNERS